VSYPGRCSVGGHRHQNLNESTKTVKKRRPKVGHIIKRISKAALYTNLKEFKPNPGHPEENKQLFYEWLKDLEIVFSNEPRLMNVIRTPEIRAYRISITTNTIIYGILLRYLSNDALLNAKSSSEVREDDGIGILKLLQTLYYGTVTAVESDNSTETRMLQYCTVQYWRPKTTRNPIMILVVSVNVFFDKR
jgi:hypothetical protein